MSQIFEILTGTFIAEEYGNATTGKRNIIQEEYHDPDIDCMVSTIIKVCDQKRAKAEKNNFKLLASWGLPVPQVYELHEHGIRVEDLTDGGQNQLIMDEFYGFENLLDAVKNGIDLKEELKLYGEILKSKGVNITKLKRVFGLVLDTQTRKGSLFFVDVDHIVL